MADEHQIIETGSWLQTEAGRQVMAWEQDRIDHAVTDAFGYHALQLGLPAVHTLRANRMPHRWVASESLAVGDALTLPPPQDASIRAQSIDQPVALFCAFDSLPFPDHSIDLVVLPHCLEVTRDPHRALSEVERVLVPEGRVVVVGFNPVSLWGLRHRVGRAGRGPGPGAAGGRAAPRVGGFIGYWRLRDWLRLLGFEVEAGRFGCYRPPVASARWLERWAWVEGVGERWWPVLGGVYFLSAVKRVRGMRLVGMARADRRNATAAPAVVARREATGSERP